MAEDVEIVTDGADETDEQGREPDPSDSLRTFGAVVQALREHSGLSKAEFAEIVRFSKHTVESVELGRRMPDEAFVERGEGAPGEHGGAAEVRPVPHSRRGGSRGVVPAMGTP